MKTVQFDSTLSSSTEIKIPDEIQSKIQPNQKVTVLLIPAGESLYDDWKEDEWTRLSQLNDEGN